MSSDYVIRLENDNKHLRMYLRDHFAMAALTGLLSRQAREGGPMRFAEDAYQFADAMLKRRI